MRPIEIVEIHGERVVMNARRREVNGAHAAVHGWIVILATRRHMDDLRFHILRDLTDLLDVVARRLSVCSVRWPW